MGHMPDSLYIAAIALGGIVFNFMYAGLNFLRMGTTGIVSQNLGSKDFEKSLRVRGPGVRGHLQRPWLERSERFLPDSEKWPPRPSL